MAPIRFRSPGVKPGQKIGPLGPFRGRLGLPWVVAPLVLGAILLVAGWLFLRGGRPSEPWRPVGTLETLAPGSGSVVDGVAVGRLPGGQVIALAEPTGCGLEETAGGYRDCDGRTFRLDGTREGPGAALEPLPVQVVRGEIYVHPGDGAPR